MLGGAVLSYFAGFGFGIASSGGGDIEGFDGVIARVADAAKAGRVPAAIANENCQASIPLRIDAVALGFLDGKPVSICTRALEPAKNMAKPLAVVDLDHKRVDSISRLLPVALLSPSLHAAATIVLTRCSKSEVGHYGYIFTHTAYQQNCGLLFVSPNGSSAMQILGFMSFWAVPPAKVDPRFTFGDVVAARPEDQMQDYIAYRASDTVRVQGR